jgi:glutathione peroxidase
MVIGPPAPYASFTQAVERSAMSDAEIAKDDAYQFEFAALDGGRLPLATWRGRPVLVVNTASFCGYTPQYRDLEALWQRYRDRGLVVLGVPSNDFGQQEPGSAVEIKKFCETTYAIDFPLTEKVRVIGAAAHPFYRWVAATLGEGAAPRWNFHKYLIDPDGELAGAWPSQVKPTDAPVTREIERLLPSG